MSTKPKRGSLDDLGGASRLIDAYIETSETLTQKQLAELELRIWEALPKDTRRQWRRDYFFQEVFGGSTRAYQVRSTLLAYGAKLNVLWRRLERGDHDRMSISTVLLLARNAKRLYASYPKKYPEFHLALNDAIGEYDALPLASVLDDGTIVRKKAPGAPPSRRDAAEKAKVSKRQNGATSPKKFYAELRTLVSRYIAERLQGVEEDTAEHIYSDFEIELKVVVEMLRQRLKTAKTQLDQERNLSDRTRRTHLRDDFVELGMDPPKPLLKPDLRKIRSQYRALARAYHPDKQPPGSPDLSAKFQSATEAYNRIVAYYRDQGITT